MRQFSILKVTTIEHYFLIICINLTNLKFLYFDILLRETEIRGMRSNKEIYYPWEYLFQTIICYAVDFLCCFYMNNDVPFVATYSADIF